VTLRDLIKNWRHHAEEAEKAQDAYHKFGKEDSAKRMEIMADIYRRCAEQLDETVGRRS
jgi:hypothetical protein